MYIGIDLGTSGVKVILLNECYALPFCGTTGAVRKSALCWKREFRNRG